MPAGVKEGKEKFESFSVYYSIFSSCSSSPVNLFLQFFIMEDCALVVKNIPVEYIRVPLGNVEN